MVSAVVGLVLLALVLAAGASVLVGVALRGRRENRSVGVTASRLHTAAGVALAIVPAVGWWIAWGRGRRRA